MLQTNKPLIKNNTFLTPFEIFIGSSLHILLLQSIVCFNFYDYTKKKTLLSKNIVLSDGNFC